MTSPRKPVASGTVIAVGVTAMFCFAMAAAVAIVFAVPDGGNPGSIITLLLGALATTVIAMVTLAKLQAVEQKVDDMMNGVMDEKIKSGVAEVLRPELLAQDARTVEREG